MKVLRMMSFSNLLDDRVKSAFVVGVIRNNALGAIRFIHGVFTFNDVTIANFPLALVVACFWIFDSILELVRRICEVILAFGRIVMLLFYDWNYWNMMLMMKVTVTFNRVVIMFNFDFVPWRLNRFAGDCSSESCKY